MLSKFLSSSYERYKQDTALFTTWLAKVATSCGYQLAKTKGVVTGTGHASGSVVQQYTVTTKELLSQAQAVAASVNPAVTLPAGLRNIVERTIRARQRCAEWFRRSKVQNKYSNEGHAHFIKVLEQSLDILDPSPATSSPASKEGTKTTPITTAANSVGDLANRFGLLDVEDTPHVDDPADVAEIVNSANTPKKTKASKGKPVVQTYELEDDEEDMAFLIFCFFEDLHRIQDYVKELWKGFQAGELSLEIAAVATNAAFGLVARAEEKILAIAPNLFNKKRSWDTIAIIIFYADAFEKGICPETRLKSNDTLRITEFDEFIYLSTARILMKFAYLSDAPAETPIPYPAPCMPLRMGYISRPELLETPEMQKKEEEDLILSQLIIDQHLWSTFKDVSSKAGSFTQSPMEDDFSKALGRFLKEGVLSVSLVFASQVFLDIQAALGKEVGTGYKDLRKTTTWIDNVMNLQVSGETWDVGGSGERWHEADMHIPLRVKMTSLHWVLDNPFPKYKKLMLPEALDEGDEFLGINPYSNTNPVSETRERHGLAKVQATSKSLEQSGAISERATPQKKTKPPRDPKFNTVSTTIHEVPKGDEGSLQDVSSLVREQLIASGDISHEDTVSPEHRENARKLNLKRIKASSDLNSVYATNPVLCGLIAFNLSTDFEAAGIALCNWHKTIWPAAHLYNALRKLSLLSQTWPEMDDLIARHQGDLFSGQLPSTPNELFTRYALSLGVSPATFARNSRHRAQELKFRKGAIGTKLKTTMASDIFRQYFDQGSMETCFVRLEEEMQKAQQGQKKKINKRPLTDLQFLEKLKRWLSEETPLVRFDYITLTKQCARILKDVRIKLTLELGIQYPVHQTQDSADQTLSLVVLKFMDEVRQGGPLDRNGRQNGPPNPQLQIASDVMQNFLKTHKPQDIVSNFNALPRNLRAPSGRVPNHWNISIRHVPMSPPGDLVFFVQPDSHYVHSEGPIQTVEGQISGHKLNPKSLATLQVIARLIMKAFVEGMGASDARGQQAPWSWATNDAEFARRITKVMRDMGVQEEALLSMPVASAEEVESCDEDWRGFMKQLTGYVAR